jgi:hypothetical protein
MWKRFAVGVLGAAIYRHHTYVSCSMNHSYNAATVRQKVNEQAKRNRDTDDRALVKVAEFLETEANRIVQTMIELCVSDYGLSGAACETFSTNLSVPFPGHSFSEKKLMLMLKEKLEKRDFKVVLWYEHGNIGQETWRSRMRIYSCWTLSHCITDAKQRIFTIFNSPNMRLNAP